MVSKRGLCAWLRCWTRILPGFSHPIYWCSGAKPRAIGIDSKTTQTRVTDHAHAPCPCMAVKCTRDMAGSTASDGFGSMGRLQMRASGGTQSIWILDLVSCFFGDPRCSGVLKIAVAARPVSGLNGRKHLWCQQRLRVGWVTSEFGLVVRCAMALCWNRNLGIRGALVDWLGQKQAG